MVRVSRHVNSRFNSAKTEFRTRTTWRSGIPDEYTMEYENIVERVYDSLSSLPNDSTRPNTLGAIAFRFIDIFDHTGNGDALDRAIHFARLAFEETEENRDEWLTRLNNYGNMVGMRYDLKGRDDDLREGVRIGRMALAACADDHPSRASTCGSLALTLFTLAQTSENPAAELDESIELAREAVQKEESTTDRAVFLNTLGNALGERYDRLNNSQDIVEAIEAMSLAISLVPPDDDRLVGFLNNLANFLWFKSRNESNVSDLEQCIECRRRVLSLTPEHHYHRGVALTNLGLCFIDLYLRKGNLSDLESAIEYERAAVSITLPDQPEYATRLDRLGTSLHASYDRTESVEALEESIQVGVQAVEAVHRVNDRSMLLNNVATRLVSMFQARGNVENVYKALEFGREAIATTTSPSLKLRFMGNVCQTYVVRFEILGTLDDLNEGIRIAQNISMLANSKEAPEVPYSTMRKLASMYFNRFERTNRIEDLTEAINLATQAIAHTNQVDPLRKASLRLDLASFLLVKYKSTRIASFLIEAEKYGKEALDLVPADCKWKRALALDTLGDISLCQKDMKSLDNVDGLSTLNTAISIREEAATQIPVGHPSRGRILYNLATTILDGYTTTKKDEYLAMAKARFVEAFQESNSPPMIRIRAGRMAGNLFAGTGDWDRAFEILKSTIELLPRISPRSLTREDIQHSVITLSGLSALAARAALEVKQPASTALALLELGRGIMSNIAIDFRDDLAGLEQKDKGLYERYCSLRSQLAISHSSRDDLVEISQDPFSATDFRLAPDDMSRRIHLVREMEALENQIRKEVPGYQQFRLPPNENFFTKLAEIGGAPIVAFNVTPKRSDAFIVTAKQVTSINLPKLDSTKLTSDAARLLGNERVTTGSNATFHTRNAVVRKVLKALWYNAIRPVLDEVGFLFPNPQEELPRIWWVTSGCMGLMPIHAAGYKWTTSKENTASHVVSSYIPTFRALSYAQERNYKWSVLDELKCSIVSMPETAGWTDLDLSTELPAVRKSLEQLGIANIRILDRPSKKQVLEALVESVIVHFACHGESNATDPSSSQLYLAPRESLSVRDVSQIHMRKALLACLSACSTAENSSPTFQDEVLHIASAFVLLGFPNVVCTLWEADDVSASQMSEFLYEELVKTGERTGGFDSGDVARAVHAASKALREGRAKEGARVKKNASENVISWGPFIHMGC